MPVIGVTGGIASGKSTVAQGLVTALQSNTPGEVQLFSADQCAHQFLAEDVVVQEEIRLDFGDGVFDANGVVDRAELRKLIFADETRRSALEAVLHPRIRKTWLQLAENYRRPANYFVAEIPLLYETECSPYFDCIVVVEADAQIQLERLSSKRGWSLETARRVIDAQMPAEEKRQRADILILNHHTKELLHRQIELAARALLTRYA